MIIQTANPACSAGISALSITRFDWDSASVVELKSNIKFYPLGFILCVYLRSTFSQVIYLIQKTLGVLHALHQSFDSAASLLTNSFPLRQHFRICCVLYYGLIWIASESNSNLCRQHKQRK